MIYDYSTGKFLYRGKWLTRNELYELRKSITFTESEEQTLREQEKRLDILEGIQMSAPNRFDVAEKLLPRLGGQIVLTNENNCRTFTRTLAATLHFGVTGVCDADSNWGLRQNPSGLIAFDVLYYKDTNEAIDIAHNGGASNAELVWQGSTPGVWVKPSWEGLFFPWQTENLPENNPPSNNPSNDPQFDELKAFAKESLEIRKAMAVDVKIIREILEKAAERFL